MSTYTCMYIYRSHRAHLVGKSKFPTIVFIVVLQKLIDSKQSHHHPVDCLNENLRSKCSTRTKQGTDERVLSTCPSPESIQ